LKTKYLIPYLAILISSCSSFPFSGPGKNKNPLFDTIPVNFTDLNSVYDDYNSAYPPGLWGFDREIAFSTNRFSEGGDFDFISFYISVQYETDGGILKEITGQQIDGSFSRHSYHYVNSENNELGPYYWKVKYQNT